MAMIDDLRAQYPQYQDMSDQALADAFHAKFYPDMPKADFEAKVGLKTAPTRQIGTLEALGRGLLQGATFNTSDEIGAGLSTGFGFLGDYGKTLKDIRDANHLASEQNPGTSLAGEIAGGLVPTAAAWLLGPEAGAPATASTGGKIAQLASRVWQGTKTGAGIGAAYGAGSYEGKPDETLLESAGGRLGSGVVGGAVGGATGAVLTPAIDLLAATGKGAANIYSAYTDPVGAARAKYGEALARGLSKAPDTEAQARADLSSLSRASPNAITGDVGGDPVQTLVRTSLNRPNAANQEFLDLTKNRQMNQWKEIEDNLSRYLGDPNQYDTVLRRLESDQAAQAHPAYDAAMAADWEPSDRLVELFRTRGDRIDPNTGDPVPGSGTIIRPTLNSIRNTVRNRFSDMYGDDANDLVDAHPLAFLQQIKQQLDKEIGQAQIRAGAGNPYSANKNDLQSLQELRRQLQQGISESTGEGPRLYQQADAQWSNAEALQNAMKNGRSAAQKTDDVIRAEMADLGPAEQQYYRFGLSRGLADKNRVGNAMNDRIGRDWSDPQDQFRIDQIFGPDAPDMRRSLEAMTAARDLRRAATGNSTTAKQLIANDDSKQDVDKVLNNVGMLKSVFSGNWADLAQRAYHSTKAELSGINPAVAEEILRIASTPAARTAQGPLLSSMVSEGVRRNSGSVSAKMQRDLAARGLMNILGSGVSGQIENSR